MTTVYGSKTWCLSFEKHPVLHTDGRGLWSSRAASVRITYLELLPDIGDLRAFFPPEDWDIFQHGFIYTDPLFDQEFKTLISNLGLTGSCVPCEQGAQGVDYVRCEFNDKFKLSFQELVERRILEESVDK